MKPLMSRNKKGEHRSLSTCEVLFHHSPYVASWPGRQPTCITHLGTSGTVPGNWDQPGTWRCGPCPPRLQSKWGNRETGHKQESMFQLGAWALRGCRSGAHCIRHALSPEEKLGGWHRSGSSWHLSVAPGVLSRAAGQRG